MVALLLAVLLQATPAPYGEPAPQALIDELVAHAQQYRATLPSITADEQIVSEAGYLIFHERVTAQGTFRVLRTADGQSLGESRTITSANGKPVATGQQPHLPVMLFGGFGTFQDMFLLPQHRACFSFTLLQPAANGQLQIALTAVPNDAWPATCPTSYQGVTGLLRLDAASHQVAHMERTVPDNSAVRGSLAPFASIDCAPAKVGDETFWLPTTVIGRVALERGHGQFTARYSNYHRYTATIRLLPGSTEVPPPSTPN